MNKLAQLALLAFIVVGISACGKMGDLEAVKAQPAIDQTVTIAPELDILPHNSK
ncbi:hypothetical protein BHECKSOX_2216 [Bathymodiolus heckerae thiotrophic gill symbiont]|uniref:hypothetical protein n=1 Tax=Bathymodiolus heckerae thiotrophic gill symbiont TaxID=1052212 RepID=UPI0010B0843D|nr:hypothetical protein [Bathymodiolus heckerae thiotrophic gill symbiont]CAC9546627.1 hypothetical protein [uncultured Gammaproteobacteria bacterium]CAC9601577.1 hypothetical protein [uncultured Gammaproteobacteria bacterium]SHN91789.1 hypothetical protein BHECKSOX_2216 [Bathymodiolus heckerae thiotrophic gill symbiont]